MANRDVKESSADPVADVLLDFQSVMAQFLELQADMVGAFAGRRPRTYAAHSATVAPSEGVPAVVVAPTIADEPLPSEGARDETAFSRYTLGVRERPFSAARATLAPGRVVVLTDDGRGVAALVARTLRNSGHRVAIISAADKAGLEHDVFVSALDSPDEAERVVRMIGESCGPVGALIHLTPLSIVPSFDTLDTASCGTNSRVRHGRSSCWRSRSVHPWRTRPGTAVQPCLHSRQWAERSARRAPIRGAFQVRAASSDLRSAWRLNGPMFA